MRTDEAPHFAPRMSRERERRMDMAGTNQTMAGRFERLPPQLYFVTSAIFHYLGPAFAVLLFAAIAPLGVAWLRIASARRLRVLRIPKAASPIGPRNSMAPTVPSGNRSSAR